jgi:hypothetical protein
MEPFISALNVAVFWIALSGPGPDLFCFERGERTVMCSNGVSAQEIGPNEIRFSNMVSVLRDAEGRLGLSNGVSVTKSGTWIKFGRDRWVRKLENGNFVFYRGPLCEAVGTGLAACRAPRAELPLKPPAP